MKLNDIIFESIQEFILKENRNEPVDLGSVEARKILADYLNNNFKHNSVNVVDQTKIDEKGFKGTFENDFWLRNNKFLDGKFKNSIWQVGEWFNGNFINSIWFDGIWHNGTFIESIWFDGIWHNGKFINSVFGIDSKNRQQLSLRLSHLQQPKWYDGEFINSTFYNGIWHNGVFKNSYWKNGTWEDGTWLGGQWFGGTWIKGKIHSTNFSIMVDSVINPYLFNKLQWYYPSSDKESFPAFIKVVGDKDLAEETLRQHRLK